MYIYTKCRVFISRETYPHDAVLAWLLAMVQCLCQCNCLHNLLVSNEDFQKALEEVISVWIQRLKFFFDFFWLFHNTAKLNVAVYQHLNLWASLLNFRQRVHFSVSTSVISGSSIKPTGLIELVARRLPPTYPAKYSVMKFRCLQK